MKAPRALKLARAEGAGGAPPPPPFGLAAFDDEASAIAFEVTQKDTLATLAQRIPSASSLPPGTVVVVLDGRARGLVAKLLRKGAPLPRDVRGSALLLRGYRELWAGVDTHGNDVVGGVA